MTEEFVGRKILMIADSDSIWTRRYIENVLLPAGFRVVLFPIYPNLGKLDDFYEKNAVEMYRDTRRLPVIRYIPRLRMWVRIYLNGYGLRRYGPFDAVHCHYISQRDLALGAMVAKRDGAVFLAKSLGSDVLRVSKKARQRMRLPLSFAKAVHTSSRQSAQLLARDCGKDIAAKVSVLNYGASEYDSIDKVRGLKSKADCRAELGIPEESYVISIGSNASSGQRQLEMLRSLSALPDEICRGFTLILVQSYGKDSDEYVENIAELLKTKPWRTLVVKKFMDAEQYAVLQLAADLFILGAVTDSFSYSLREYLYAGACALKGSWLEYDELNELGIHVQSFENMDALPQAVLRMRKEGKPLDEQKRERMKESFSWQGVIPKWLSYYHKEDESR